MHFEFETASCFLFYIVKHRHTLFVPSALEFGVKPALYDKLRQLRAYNSCAEAKHVRIVVPSRKLCRIRL